MKAYNNYVVRFTGYPSITIKASSSVDAIQTALNSLNSTGATLSVDDFEFVGFK